MKEQKVTVENLYLLDHDVAFGMVKDGKKETGKKDD